MQHRGTISGLTVLAILLGISTCFSQDPSSPERSGAAQNPYDTRLSVLQAKWKTQASIERAVAVRRIYDLREFVSSTDAVTRWIAGVEQDLSESRSVRDEARHYRALMERHSGRRTDVPALPAELLTEARSAAAKEPYSAEVNEALGLIERERGLASAGEHLERAAQLAPTAERWMEVAEGCGDSICTSAALRAALQADATNPEAKTALAEYYVGRKQDAKARDLLCEAAQSEPGDYVARKRLGDLYASAGMVAEALAEYRHLEKAFPAPLWLRRELALAYERLGFLDRAMALAKSDLEQNFDDRVVRGILIRIYRTRGDAGSLRVLYADLMRLDNNDTEAMARTAELDAGQGNFRTGESLMRRAIGVSPDDGVLRQQFADLLAAEGKQIQAREQLAKALQSNPNDEEVRRRLAYERGVGVTRDADAAYLVNAAELARSAPWAKLDENSNATVLADVRIERVQEDGLASVRVQQVFQINTEQGARDYARRTVQYAAGTQELRVLAARLFKRDGRVIDAEDSGDAVEEGTAGMYYDARSRMLRFPGVETGDVVEMDYRLTPDSKTNPYRRYLGNLVMFRSSLPQRLQRYVLVTPASQKFNIVAARMPAAEVGEQDGHRIYLWETRDVAALPNEPKGPPVSETAPYVHASSFATWQELGSWYAQLIAPQFALDHALREALDQVVADKATDQEKIHAIHQFVLRNTHYVALEFGVYGYKPYPVSQVYARRFGDCKDKASLMVALLSAAGIEADIALVRTRRLGDIGEQATSISVFNHAVVYVPKYDLWLDGTAEYAGSRELPLEDQGAMALTVALNGNAQLRRIPVALPMENYTHRQVQAKILPDGRLEFSGSAYVRGEDAPGLRREYEVTERQRDSVRNRLAEVLPRVRVDAVQVYGANDLEHDVTVKFSGEVEMFAGRPSLTLQTSWMQRAYVQKLAALPWRAQDLLLPAPWTTEEELHFALPAGARLDSIPPDKTLVTPFGTALLRYQRQGSELIVTTSVQFRKLRITPSEYAAFRDFCAQLESAFHAEIKVGLKG